ncbi:MAG: GntR family transcriptional regulator [Acidobacteriaceae bacterium]
MQFWFARGSEIPVRQQLVTQVVLGILCHDLAPRERLPSTRELARRFRIHPNTISAAYRQLGQEKWVEFRRGSGVYVRAVRPKAIAAAAPESLIANLVLESRRAGLSLHELRQHLQRWLEMRPPTHFCLIEPDEGLRRIAIAELEKVARMPVKGCGFAELRSGNPGGAIWVVFPSKAAAAREVLGAEAEMLVLEVRSAPSSMAQLLPKSREWLVGVASGWPGFLDTAQTMLAAAGFDPDSLVVRDTRRGGWLRDLECTAGILCDAATAQVLPKGKLTVVFPIVADASLEELKRYEEFIGAAAEQDGQARGS